MHCHDPINFNVTGAFLRDVDPFHVLLRFDAVLFGLSIVMCAASLLKLGICALEGLFYWQSSLEQKKRLFHDVHY